MNKSQVSPCSGSVALRQLNPKRNRKAFLIIYFHFNVHKISPKTKPKGGFKTQSNIQDGTFCKNF